MSKLAELQKEEKEEEKEEKESKESKQETPMSMLSKLPGAPSKEQVELWKTEFGDVFITGFSGKEMYVWRTISRGEYLTLQEQVAKDQLSESDTEMLLAGTCVLWPARVDWSTGKAGTPTTLSELIMQRSNFYSGMAANMLVAQL